MRCEQPQARSGPLPTGQKGTIRHAVKAGSMATHCHDYLVTDCLNWWELTLLIFFYPEKSIIQAFIFLPA